MLAAIVLIFLPIFMVLLALSALVHIFFLVPYVPSKNNVVKEMIRAAKLKPNETVFDLGCGDGRLLIEAERKAKVKAVGFELAPLVYLIALARKFFARAKTKIKFQNFFHANLSKANVIFCYLLPNVMPRLAEKIKKECKRGTRIVSNTLHIADLKSYRIFKKDAAKGLPTIYVYKI